MKILLDLLTEDKIAWATDLHLDWCTSAKSLVILAEQAQLTSNIVSQGWTAISTGDLSSNGQLGVHAALMKKASMHFILGNHDYWGNTFNDAGALAEKFGEEYYLHGKVLTRPSWAMVGHNGFFDFRTGIVAPSLFQTWDSEYNPDLKGKSYHQIAYMLPTKAEVETNALLRLLDTVDKPRIYVATHVPPFPEACLYQGKPSRDEALPFFCNTTLGEELLTYVYNRRDVQFIVLAGHTHHDYVGWHAPNLLVGVSAKAKYGWYAHNNFHRK